MHWHLYHGFMICVPLTRLGLACVACVAQKEPASNRNPGGT